MNLFLEQWLFVLLTNVLDANNGQLYLKSYQSNFEAQDSFLFSLTTYILMDPLQLSSRTQQELIQAKILLKPAKI